MYFRWEPILGADPATFKPLDTSYGKDDKHVFFQADRVLNADAATFRLVGGNGVDRHRAYYGMSPKSICDPESFTIELGWIVDKLCVYDDELSRINGVDRPSFKPLDRDYAKDKSVGYTVWNRPRPHALPSYEMRVISDICDASTLKIDREWIVDRQCVYDKYFDRLVGVDRASFRILDEGYAKDRYNVYSRLGFAGRTGPLDGADPSTIRVVSDCHLCVMDAKRCFKEAREVSCKTWDW